MGNTNYDIKLEDITFMGKKRVVAMDETDVYVSLVKLSNPTSKGDKKLCFSFRDSVSEVFKNEKYITFGAYENRIYFKPIESSVGYKIYKRDYTRVFSCTLTKDELEIYSKFAKKTYHLKHDDNLHLYYIELKEQDY